MDAVDVPANASLRPSARWLVPRLVGRALPHVVLLVYTVIALFPVVLVIINSFKVRNAIFRTPYQPPLPSTFDLVGYETVFARASFQQYFFNSFVVTFTSLFMVLLTGSMAAYALSEYRFPGNRWLGLYLAIGIMIPIRLGTVSLLRLMVGLNLVNTLAALLLVYIAQGLPLTVFILTQFMYQVPRELKEAARMDGASEYWIYWLSVLLVRPALGAVAIFTMIPIWNDLWFPLILAPGDATATVTLGVQQFIGQFVSDWNAILASLTLAMVPVLVLYMLFSRQLIRGITAGAVK
ncbi:MAG: carbohydrate ABC transporter permease [Chloroflexi bacterium]|nr:carbohydrate ABC transporter permease [Chloroflexota bacterium]MCI0576914.1 carbohydrate ABC transporter permease [Chloroflexota bacterium]MCI0649698.1 carbohydrate ABC transporter permease [Chloroflexota bacterium]MCI0729939.1 carbohydrate ABC transporter permease [Chloroflexota bacterium]